MKNTAMAISILLVACSAPGSRPDLYGSSAVPSSALRTIVINPDTKYVNVEGGEIVRFVADGKEFAWDFTVAMTVSSFALDRVAPAGMLDHEVRAYVSADPRYAGGGDKSN